MDLTEAGEVGLTSPFGPQLFKHEMLRWVSSTNEVIHSSGKRQL